MQAHRYRQRLYGSARFPYVRAPLLLVVPTEGMVHEGVRGDCQERVYCLLQGQYRTGALSYERGA